MDHLTAEQEGDVVAEFQQLCEVQSDKASVEITSQYAGTITRLLHSEGDIVQVRPSLSALVHALLGYGQYFHTPDAPQ